MEQFCSLLLQISLQVAKRPNIKTKQEYCKFFIYLAPMRKREGDGEWIVVDLYNLNTLEKDTWRISDRTWDKDTFTFECLANSRDRCITKWNRDILKSIGCFVRAHDGRTLCSVRPCWTSASQEWGGGCVEIWSHWWPFQVSSNASAIPIAFTIHYSPKSLKGLMYCHRIILFYYGRCALIGLCFLP